MKSRLKDIKPLVKSRTWEPELEPKTVPLQNLTAVIAVMWWEHTAGCGDTSILGRTDPLELPIQIWGDQNEAGRNDIL